MAEAKRQRMKVEPRCTLAAVLLVAYHWMARLGKMDANLVLATGLELHLDERSAVGRSLLSGKERLTRQFKIAAVAYLPEKVHKRLFKIADVFNNKCGKFIVGKIIDSFIIGLMCFIGLSIFRFHYPLLISVIIGVCNMIPFFGPIIGAIPTTFLLLIINPWEALGFLVFIIVLQQFDGNILGPKILGETVGISGFWIMFSVIVGGGLFSVPGMLLGVPVFAAIYTLVEEGAERRLKKKDISANDIAPEITEDYPKQKKLKSIKDSAFFGKASELINKGKNK